MLQTAQATGLRVLDLSNQLIDAMEDAEKSMQLHSAAIPAAYTSGGGCYTGFGTALNNLDCILAYAKMPSENRPNDVYELNSVPQVAPVFEQRYPRIWSHKNCIIGASVYDERQAKGLYPAFRFAAGLILDKCVARATGGLLRFAHFEVVMFDGALLPRDSPFPLSDFTTNFANIPFSKGLTRLWSARGE